MEIFNKKMTLADIEQHGNMTIGDSQMGISGSESHSGNVSIEEELSSLESMSSDSSSESDGGETDIVSIPQIIQCPTRHPADGCGRQSPVFFDKSFPAYEGYIKKCEPLKGVARMVTQAGEQLGKCIENGESINSSLIGRFLPQVLNVLGGKYDLSVEEGQPFRLELIRELLIECEDEDVGGVPERGGVSVLFKKEVPKTGLWPSRTDKKYDAQRELVLWDNNYVSCEENLDLVQKMVEEEIAQGWVKQVKKEEVGAQGILGFIQEGKRADGSQKYRIVYDSSAIGVNYHILLTEAMEYPTIEEVIAAIKEFRTRGMKISMLKWDFKAALRRVKVRGEERTLLGFTLGGKWFTYCCLPFGFKLSSYHWGRLAACITRLVKKILVAGGMDLFLIAIYVDDGILICPDQSFYQCMGTVFIILMMVGSPIEHRKTIYGKEGDWTGYFVSLKDPVYLVGLTDSKRYKLVDGLLQILEGGPKIDFRLYEKWVHRYGWYTRIVQYVRPFLKRGYGAVSQIRRQFERKKGNLKDRRWQNSAFIPLKKVKDDLPVLAWVLCHRPTVCLPDPREAVHHVMFRTDAMGQTDQGGIGGWCYPFGRGCEEDYSSTDLQKALWFRYYFKRGEPVLQGIFGDAKPQSVIAAAECLGNLVGMHVFAPGGKTFHSETDSMVTKLSVQKYKAKARSLVMVLRAYGWRCLVEDKWPVVGWLPGEKNEISDAISRAMVEDRAAFVTGLLNPNMEVTVNMEELLWIPALKNVQRELEELKEWWRERGE